MKKNTLLVSLIVGLLILSQSNVIEGVVDDYGYVYTLPYSDLSNDVHKCVDDNGVALSVDETELEESIDIGTVGINKTHSKLELSFYGTPVLDPSYEYRILLCWNTYFGSGFEGNWSSLDWDLPIYETANVTLCVAGGGSWFGVTNGSYNSFVNNQNESIFLEKKSDSVTIVGNSFIFDLNTTYFATTQELGQIILFATYDISNSTTRIILFDAMPDTFLTNFFPRFTPFGKIDFLVLTTLFTLVGVGQILIITRRRRK